MHTPSDSATSLLAMHLKEILTHPGGGTYKDEPCSVLRGGRELAAIESPSLGGSLGKCVGATSETHAGSNTDESEKHSAVEK